MKKQCSYAILALIPLACKNPTPQSSLPAVPIKQTINILNPLQQSDLLNKRLHSFRQAAQKFVVSTDSRHQLIGKKGTIIELQAADLETTDGSPMGRQIDVALLELQDQNDFLKNTITTTSNGRLLVSGGAYYINCTSGGKTLRIKKGKTIAVSIPKLTHEKMNLFYGETLSDGSINWQPSKRAFADRLTQDSVWANVPELTARDTMYGSDWHTRYEPQNTVVDKDGHLRPDTTPALNNNVLTYVLDTEYHSRRVAVTPNITDEGYEQIALSQLGWINCDRYYDAEKTDLAIDLPVVEQHVCIKTFIVYKTLNSVSEHDFTTNEQHNHVVLPGLPAGQSVRITSLAYYDGKMHTFTKEIKLTPHTHIAIQMKEAGKDEVNKLFETKI